MLAGAANFRDLGGLPTQDGRRIRHGLLYRSNSFARVSDDDVALLDRLGLRIVIDLRTRAERARSPSRWSGGAARTIGSDHADSATMLAPILEQGEGGEAEWRRRFSVFFAGLPELYAREYAAMFRALAEGAVPLLVNCSAGKDRTGVAVLLILTILGVDREVAFADYLLSGERLHGDPAFVEMLTGKVLAGFAHLPPVAKAVMLGVHRDHAEAALASIRRYHGSVEAYVTGRLGLSTEDLATIRESLTEPA